MNEQIAEAITDTMPDADVQVALQGNRAHIRVVSRRFEGMSTVARHQAVYACINRFIADGTVHAVSIDALTPDEAA